MRAHNETDFLRTAGECGVAHTMIDLGEVPKHREHTAATAATRPPVPYRPVLGALSILLIVLLAGAAHRNPPRPPVIIPARLSDVTFVDGDRLFVVGVGPALLGSDVQNKVVSRYTLPGAKLLSRTTVAVAGSVSNVRWAGGTILVSYRVDATGSEATVAATEGTATALWRQPFALVVVSAAAGAALVNFDYGRPGDFGWAVVDLKTGVIRWSLRQPLNGYISDFGYADGFPRWFVTLTADGHVEIRDARTGAVTATGTVPRIGRNVNGSAWSVDDLLMVVTGRTGVTAYTLPGLTPRWHSDVDLLQGWLQTGCGAVICTFGQQRGMAAFDPATGRKLWDSDRWAYAEPIGRYLAATLPPESIDQPKLWLLDPLTGRVYGNFGAWQSLGTDGESTLTYAMNQVYGTYVVWYGVLDPDRLRVRILGSASRVSGDCHVSAGALICRLVDASVGVWQLG